MLRAVHPTECSEITTGEAFLATFARARGRDESAAADTAPEIVIQGLDLTDSAMSEVLSSRQWSDVIFLGCDMSDEAEAHVVGTGATVFPPFAGLPYDPYRSALYTTDELAEDDLDRRIYEHQARFRTSPSTPIMEALAERIHDHSIDTALDGFLSECDKVVAVMGGHSIARGETSYRQVSTLTRMLTRKGYMVVSGGGPGAMEAANLGAWMANHHEDDLFDAIEALSQQTDYTADDYQPVAGAVLDRFPGGAPSLAIPTWFYGHEPTNLFATAVAKYFSNSIREDGLLAIATHGVVYTPGAAGTVQEVFMDATQNHYVTFDVISPMVFLDSEYWHDDGLGAPRLLRQLAGDLPYADMIAVLDEPESIVEYIELHPPLLPSKRS